MMDYLHAVFQDQLIFHICLETISQRLVEMEETKQNEKEAYHHGDVHPADARRSLLGHGRLFEPQRGKGQQQSGNLHHRRQNRIQML